MRSAWLIAITAAVVGACVATTEDEGADDASALVTITRTDEDPALLVKDPSTLAALEERFSLATMLHASPNAKTAADLAASPAYRAIADAVTADVKALAASDRDAGKGFAFAHRSFDDHWLVSPDARFELTGITNRIDLLHRGGCGEIHFVYRLAYSHVPGGPETRVDSRLPFTVNVLVPMKDDGAKCSSVAKQWLAVDAATAAGTLTGGPLAHVEPPSHVEINYQLVRWPSTTRPDMGGHAEYVLRSFAVGKDGGLTKAPLDDTPRTDLSPDEKATLKGWITENLEAIDEGTAIVPEALLATEATSVAPHAAVRLANHPFSELFTEKDLATLPLSKTTSTRSARALLHKLDGMTCQGCHQSRGIAGFHLLGEERLGTVRLNALAVGASPHTLAAVAWRKSFLTAVAAGATPPKRPAADHASGTDGAYGDHCSLDHDPGFEGWACKASLTCKRVDDDVIGHCLPPGEPGFGDACEDSSTTASRDPHTDCVNARVLACAAGATCQRSGSGFPDGVCQSRCTVLGQKTGDVVCSGVPFGTGPLGGFNNCLFKLRRPFQECLADDVRPTSSRACDDKNPCRDDYLCARIFVKPGDGTSVALDPTGGACMPPYFVFQGRVDGHTLR